MHFILKEQVEAISQGRSRHFGGPIKLELEHLARTHGIERAAAALRLAAKSILLQQYGVMDASSRTLLEAQGLQTQRMNIEILPARRRARTWPTSRWPGMREEGGPTTSWQAWSSMRSRSSRS